MVILVLVKNYFNFFLMNVFLNECIFNKIIYFLGFKVGDAVILYIGFGCRQCDYCRGGESRMCDTNYPAKENSYGLTQNGGFQTHMTVFDVADMVKVDPGLPLDAACLLPCGGLTAYGALLALKGSIDKAMKITGRSLTHVLL